MYVVGRGRSVSAAPRVPADGLGRIPASSPACPPPGDPWMASLLCTTGCSSIVKARSNVSSEGAVKRQ
jgi:hypothetical protein